MVQPKIDDVAPHQLPHHHHQPNCPPTSDGLHHHHHHHIIKELLDGGAPWNSIHQISDHLQIGSESKNTRAAIAQKSPIHRSEKTERAKFSVALSKREIEEDAGSLDVSIANPKSNSIKSVSFPNLPELQTRVAIFTDGGDFPAIFWSYRRGRRFLQTAAIWRRFSGVTDAGGDFYRRRRFSGVTDAGGDDDDDDVAADVVPHHQFLV
ncbi:hypothetical protein CASFOL_026735 [Castilleja foliolosa]|uniref:Uncharacterized protein n=1 Tax=Castilleja foliolosa TaxID=1961234 RepID=A0ABD3CHW4_9LAMI